MRMLNSIDPSILARQFGLDGDQASAVLNQLLPALGGGLKQNAAQPGGLESLLGALTNGNHQRYIDQPEVLNQPESIADGNGILGHLLGSKDASRALASQVSSATGISDDLIRQMLPAVASLLMGSLSKQRESAPSGGLLSMLDFDGDGSAIDDITGMLGNFLKR